MKNYFFSVLIFGLIIYGFIGAIASVDEKSLKEEEKSLESAIKRATIQCYAIEGRYPPSVAYLEDNYGLQINRKHFAVFYEGFASNIMPEIYINTLTDNSSEEMQELL